MNSPPAGYSFGFSTDTNTNQFDLIVSVASSSETWNSTGSPDYGTAANWSPANVPNGAGLIATFGTGSQMSVTVNGALHRRPVGLQQLHRFGVLRSERRQPDVGQFRQRRQCQRRQRRLEPDYLNHADARRFQHDHDIQRRQRQFARRGRTDQRIDVPRPKDRAHRRRHT